MRPWIAVAYSAPVAAATAVFLIYPIGQGSFLSLSSSAPLLLVPKYLLLMPPTVKLHLSGGNSNCYSSQVISSSSFLSLPIKVSLFLLLSLSTKTPLDPFSLF
jgi:hypothetical protein